MNEGVQRRVIVEVHDSAFDLLHRPPRLPRHRLKLGRDPLLQTVHERLGALRHESAGVLRGARQAEVQRNAHRKRDQNAEPDHRDCGDGEPIPHLANDHPTLSPTMIELPVDAAAIPSGHSNFASNGYVISGSAPFRVSSTWSSSFTPYGAPSLPA